MLILQVFFGCAVGSFLGVIASRYDPERFLLGRHVIGGRSRCPACGATLRWFELIPIVSFLVQRGRCRTCAKPIALEHFFIEGIAGALFAVIPAVLTGAHLGPYGWLLGAKIGIWLVVFSILLLISFIDLRLNIIPDEANIVLALCGVMLAVLERSTDHAQGAASFLGSYAILFGMPDSLWINRLFALGAAFLLFGGLVLVTRGKGMGMGDVKLALALAILFGWPDILLLSGLAFIIGSVFGLYEVFWKEKSMRSAVAFGPFLALGALTVFFFGEKLVRTYFGILS